MTGHRHIDAGSEYRGPQPWWIFGVQKDHKLLILRMAKREDVCRQLGLKLLSTKIRYYGYQITTALGKPGLACESLHKTSFQAR